MIGVLGAASDPCGDRQVWLCHWVSNLTDNRTVANTARYVSPWLSILLIAITAAIGTRICRWFVRRAAHRWESAGRFTALRKRARLPLVEPVSPLVSERRHQRAETIGLGLSS